jgi:hypothetical protein
MDRNAVVVGAVIAAAFGWNVVTARQAGQPRPGIGDGVVTVNGAVDVRNAPVAATGAWRVNVDGWPDVRITNQPTVSVAPLSFVKTGAQIVVTWNTGETEKLVVVATGPGGWLQVSPTRWINAALAKSIEVR